MIKTPFYYYDLELLEKTLQEVKKNIQNLPFEVHYALKANAEDRILNLISSKGFGADCVSGNEIKKAIECGFDSNGIVLAGVGKSDEEIKLAIEKNILSINCESIEEIQVIASLSGGKTTNIALRLNPNIDANTHPSITTGTAQNKFGIPSQNLWLALEELDKYSNLNFIGIHVHLGSQITRLAPFEELCQEVNTIQSFLISKGKNLPHLNLGGGLGIDYDHPKVNPMPDFQNYFKIFETKLNIPMNQTVHFELGRSIVGQSGSLISKVLYVKKTASTKFAILDAGMTELLRPALYKANHAIENISSNDVDEKYQVVGPICETTDTFGEVFLPKTKRGDFVKIHSTGAYGQVLSSNYNLRNKPRATYSDELNLSELLD